MKQLTTFALLSVLLISGIQSAFAGPFGIEMGMNLAEVRQACGATPELMQDKVYEITPPRTNDMFETYYVRIDPEYGVYWLKAIGKDVYTNGHGERLVSEFETLVASIRRTYGEESYRNDDLKDDSIWTDSQYFMLSLWQGDRKLDAYWFDPLNDISIIGVFTKATSTSEGYVTLEYSFSNSDAVDAKEDSVF